MRWKRERREQAVGRISIADLRDRWTADGCRSFENRSVTMNARPEAAGPDQSGCCRDGKREVADTSPWFPAVPRSRPGNGPWIGTVRRPEDRLSDRLDGENSRREHSTRDGRAVQPRVQAI